MRPLSLPPRVCASLALWLALGCTPAQAPSSPPGPDGQGSQGGGTAGSGGAPAAQASGGAGAAGSGTGGANPGSGGAGGAAGSGGMTGGASDAAPTGDAPAAPPPSGRKIVVAAGKHRREATIVTFTLPGASPGSYGLRDGAGADLPLQVDDDGKAVFILPALDAGAEASYTLGPGTPQPMTVQVAKETDGVKVTQGAATVFRYQMQGKLPPGIGAAFLRGGYLHPIFTPAGLLVSGDYPGDHRHHHGLWSAWAKTSFEGKEMDFWNMGGRSAKVDFDALLGTWDGIVHGGLKTRQVHVALAGGPKTALNETWNLTVYRTHAAGVTPPYFVFDLDSVQEAAGAPVMLHQYIYGGFALRGNDAWSGAGGAVYLTSEGKTRSNGDGTDARWCYIGGKVDGKLAGYAALVHPTNFRAPQPVRINPTDQFFSIAPVRDSGFDITAGKPYVSRYRIVVTDGGANATPDGALLERLWQDYAEPPAVTVQ